ncbi:MAG: hypothetical protein MZV70_18765 [Desulfobacterales bacterium]|nr:hypothetical protein [Desulfobacterales bacterium]
MSISRAVRLDRGPGAAASARAAPAGPAGGRSPAACCGKSSTAWGFWRDVGLAYLTLDRSAQTLSGGESQRIRLATQIGSKLTGVLYVLDEPSIGLHPRDTGRLLDNPAGGCGTWATPCWSSSTTRRPSARPTTSSTWDRAPASTAAGWCSPAPPPT